MRNLARALLKLTCAAAPVFVAACYGAPMSMRRQGGVASDRATGKPVAGLQIECVSEGGGAARDTTGADGTFQVPPTCKEVRVSDVDGPANGAYRPAVLPVAEGGAPLRVQLDPVE